MDSARWSPPIPSGAAALTAWRELDRGTRRGLLRAAAPHPDPVVACVAVGYARTMLQAGLRTFLRRLAQAMGLMVAFVVVLVVATIASGGSRPATIASIGFLVLAMIWFVRRSVRFRLGLIRMENVNAPALLAGQTPMTVPPRAAGTPLSVAFDRRSVLRVYARPLALTVLLAAGLPFLLGRVFLIALVPLAISWALMVYHLIRWVLPGRPVLTVDGGGPRFAGGFALSWPEITEIRIHPLRAGNRLSRSSVIAFVCADPQAIITRMRGMRRWNARRALEFYGSPVVLPSRNLDRTVEEIAAAVTSFHPVPVRRFGT